ncbi:MAG: DUF58 domain-containing protein, partial [bacterium]
SIKIEKFHIYPLQIYKNQTITLSLTIKNTSKIPLISVKLNAFGENIYQENINNIFFLLPSSSKEVKIELKAIKRGFIEKMKIHINASLFFQISPPVEKEIETYIYIYPNFAKINIQDVIKIDPENNLSLFYKLTEEGEFFSIREYNLDDIKKTAWKQWAKTGKPVVKQKFQYSNPKIFFLIYNIYLNESENEEFVERINSLFKYYLSNNIEINVSTLEDPNNFKKISDIKASLVFLSTLNFTHQTSQIPIENQNTPILIVNKNFNKEKIGLPFTCVAL